MVQLTAAIISYQSADVLPACIRAALRWTDDVLVIDNASTDGSAAVARSEGARVIANAENRGFGPAADQAFENSTRPFVLILNPDVEVGEGRDALLAACHGASAGVLLATEGQVQAGFSVRRLPTPVALISEVLGVNRIWRNNPANRRWRCLDVDLSKEQDVEQPAGAFLLVRREAWRSVGGFDHQFQPVWFEDVDLCARLRAAGWRIRFTPRARAVHQGGHSVGKMARPEREVQWYVSLLRYAAKHFSRGEGRLVALAVAFSTVPRGIWCGFRWRSVAAFAAYARVLSIALQYVTGGGQVGEYARSSKSRAGAAVTDKKTDTDRVQLHVP